MPSYLDSMPDRPGMALRSPRRPARPERPPLSIEIDGKFFSRGQQRFRVQGVTYGPFDPGRGTRPFPGQAEVRRDFEMMRAAGINAIRTYHVPEGAFLELAEEAELSVLVDIPWSKHVCFLESSAARAEARCAARRAAQQGLGCAAIFAYSLANEIPADIVRWHGSRRVERFLKELADVVKQADPRALVTYGNYPSTEFLELPFLDFATFNVYLHERATFRRYLHRLQNLVGDRPLVLGELGMDTLRHTELEQAEFLSGHLREATLMGLAGSFVFSWTDEWHTGGHAVEDWAFGLTDRLRAPKAAYHAVREVFECPTEAFLEAAPRVSVVVCTHNGGATLEQCLRSLARLHYPDYEVLVVDDGSTDGTARILDRFPQVVVIRQEHRGLSAARNAGLRAATGPIVAYTDSDCYVDVDWLTHLVHTASAAPTCRRTTVGWPAASPPAPDSRRTC
jgi:hypothetical protein